MSRPDGVMIGCRSASIELPLENHRNVPFRPEVHVGLAVGGVWRQRLAGGEHDHRTVFRDRASCQLLRISLWRFKLSPGYICVIQTVIAVAVKACFADRHTLKLTCLRVIAVNVVCRIGVGFRTRAYELCERPENKEATLSCGLRFAEFEPRPQATIVDPLIAFAFVQRELGQWPSVTAPDRSGPEHRSAINDVPPTFAS